MLKIFRKTCARLSDLEILMDVFFTRLNDVEALTDALNKRIKVLEIQNKTATATKKKAAEKNEK